MTWTRVLRYGLGPLFATLLAMVPPSPALGDSPLDVRLSDVDAASFPQLVTIATVRDWTGLPVADLTQANFEVLEDGRVVDAEIVPVEDDAAGLGVVLAIDTSGSINPPTLQTIKLAAHDFVGSLGRSDRVAIQSFGFPNCSVTQLQSLNDDPANLGGAIDSLRAAGNTPLFDAAVEGMGQIARLQPGSKALILLTDGEDTCSRFKADDVIAIATRDHIPIFSVGLGPDVQPAVLERISVASGGQYLSAADVSELPGIYSRLAHDLRRRYEVRLKSGQLADHREHSLEIRVSGADGAGRAEIKFTPPIFEPKVRLNLESGAVVGEPIELVPTFTVPVRLARVEYLIDGISLHTASEPPFSYVFDPRGLGSGPRELKVQVTDAFGGTSHTDVPIQIVGFPVWILLLAVLVLPILAIVGVFLMNGRRRRRRRDASSRQSIPGAAAPSAVHSFSRR